MQNLAGVNLFFDGNGTWHGTLIPKSKRFNCLFADFHVKNVDYGAMEAAWLVPIGR